MYTLNDNMFNGIICTDTSLTEDRPLTSGNSVECLYFNNNFEKKNAEI